MLTLSSETQRARRQMAESYGERVARAPDAFVPSAGRTSPTPLKLAMPAAADTAIAPAWRPASPAAAPRHCRSAYPCAASPPAWPFPLRHVSSTTAQYTFATVPGAKLLREAGRGLARAGEQQHRPENGLVEPMNDAEKDVCRACDTPLQAGASTRRSSVSALPCPESALLTPGGLVEGQAMVILIEDVQRGRSA